MGKINIVPLRTVKQTDSSGGYTVWHVRTDGGCDMWAKQRAAACCMPDDTGGIRRVFFVISHRKSDKNHCTLFVVFLRPGLQAPPLLSCYGSGTETDRKMRVWLVLCVFVWVFYVTKNYFENRLP